MSFIDFTNLSYDMWHFALEDPLGHLVKYVDREEDEFYAPHVVIMDVIRDESTQNTLLQIKVSAVDFNTPQVQQNTHNKLTTLRKTQSSNTDQQRKRDFINRFFCTLLGVIIQDNLADFLTRVASSIGDETTLPVTIPAISVYWNDTMAAFAHKDPLVAASRANDNLSLEQHAMALIGYIVFVILSDGEYYPYDPNLIEILDPVLNYHLALAFQKNEQEQESKIKQEPNPELPKIDDNSVQK